MLGQLWSLGRKVEDLLALQGKTHEALDALDKRLRGVEDRLRDLEATQGQVIVEARAAAGAASTMVAGTILSDVVTRLTRIEMRTEAAVQLLMPPDPAQLRSAD